MDQATPAELQVIAPLARAVLRGPEHAATAAKDLVAGNPTGTHVRSAVRYVLDRLERHKELSSAPACDADGTWSCGCYGCQALRAWARNASLADAPTPVKGDELERARVAEAAAWDEMQDYAWSSRQTGVWMKTVHAVIRALHAHAPAVDDAVPELVDSKPLTLAEELCAARRAFDAREDTIERQWERKLIAWLRLEAGQRGAKGTATYREREMPDKERWPTIARYLDAKGVRGTWQGQREIVFVWNDLATVD